MEGDKKIIHVIFFLGDSEESNNSMKTIVFYDIFLPMYLINVRQISL